MFYENKSISLLLYTINFQDFDLQSNVDFLKNATKMIDWLIDVLDKLSAKCINVYVNLYV